MLRIIMFIFVSMITVGSSSTDIFLPSLSEISKYFGATVPVTNLTISLFAAGMAIGCLFSGYLSDRLGRKRALLFAGAVYIVTTTIIALSFSIWMMIAFRFVQGLTVGIPIIVTRQIIREHFPKEMHLKSFAALSTGVVLSPAVAPIIGAYIADVASWRWCFAVSATAYAVLLAATIFYIPETLTETVPFPSVRSIVGDMGHFMSSRIFVSFSLITMSLFGAYFAFIAMSNSIYVGILKLSPIMFSKLFLLLAVSYLIGNRILSFLDGKGWRKVWIIATGVGLSAIGSFLFLAALFEKGNLALIVTISLAVSFVRMGYACAVNPVSAAIMNIFPEKSGTAIGLNLFTISISGSVCAMTVSLFHDRLILGMSLATLVLVAVAVVSYFVTLKEVKRLYPDITLTSLNKKEPPLSP